MNKNDNCNTGYRQTNKNNSSNNATTMVTDRRMDKHPQQGLQTDERNNKNKEGLHTDERNNSNNNNNEGYRQTNGTATTTTSFADR